MTIQEVNDKIGWPVRVKPGIQSDLSSMKILTNMGADKNGMVTVIGDKHAKHVISCDDLDLAQDQVRVSIFRDVPKNSMLRGRVRKLITKDEFRLTHKACPECGNETLRVTLIDYAQKAGRDYVDKNKVWCEKDSGGCGWKGTRMDLVPSKGKTIIR